MQKHYPKLIWLWLIFLITFNVIPLGSSDPLSKKKLLELRLDYFIHSVIFLGFAWLWVFSRILGFQFFNKHERLIYACFIICAGIALEYLQKIIPWRSFNPIDLYFNLFGAGVALLFLGVGKRKQPE